MLAVVETHPIQYHVPVYRALQHLYGVPVAVIYGSDFSVHRYRDREFGAELSWDVDLLGGVSNEFLARVAEGGHDDPMRVSARGIGTVLDRLAPAAVLIVGYSPAFHRRAWAAARRRGVPILFRGETTDVDQTRRRSVAAARDLALRLAYRTCARLLYIGERSRRHYRAHGVDDARLVFSPYCVDTTPFRATEGDRVERRGAARAMLGLADDRIVLLFSGKLSARKGVDLIGPAVRLLPPDVRSRVVIVCAGDGAAREAMAADAAIEPGVPLVVLGVQTQAALSGWYHAGDLLVLPSVHGETWGLVVNEALHHGLPAVVSDRVGCAPDLIDETTGAVCAAGLPAALAAAIGAALPLAGRADIREACRVKADAYSVDRAAAGLADAYRAATDGRSAA
jgi:glycosyltransferase involved in cell wall biosynthesis